MPFCNAKFLRRQVLQELRSQTHAHRHTWHKICRVKRVEEVSDKKKGLKGR